MDKENSYKNLTKNICRRRKKEWATKNYNNEFADYLQSNYKPVDILIHLAEQSSIVLLYGSGFSVPEWSIRISLANLNDESYSKIGEKLYDVIEEYVEKWKNSNNDIPKESYNM